MLMLARELAHENLSYQKQILQTINSKDSHSQGIGESEPKGFQDAVCGEKGFAIPFLDWMTSNLNETIREGFRLRLQQDIKKIINDPNTETLSKPLLPVISETRQDDLVQRILASLYYARMRDREGRITEAYGSTFQWISKTACMNKENGRTLRSGYNRIHSFTGLQARRDLANQH
jgi:hypothetical protein